MPILWLECWGRAYGCVVGDAEATKLQCSCGNEGGAERGLVMKVRLEVRLLYGDGRWAFVMLRLPRLIWEAAR